MGTNKEALSNSENSSESDLSLTELAYTTVLRNLATHLLTISPERTNPVILSQTERLFVNQSLQGKNIYCVVFLGKTTDGHDELTLGGLDSHLSIEFMKPDYGVSYYYSQLQSDDSWINMVVFNGNDFESRLRMIKQYSGHEKAVEASKHLYSDITLSYAYLPEGVTINGTVKIFKQRHPIVTETKELPTS